jgi:hypothetical protein
MRRSIFFLILLFHMSPFGLGAKEAEHGVRPLPVKSRD